MLLNRTIVVGDRCSLPAPWIRGPVDSTSGDPGMNRSFPCTTPWNRPDSPTATTLNPSPTRFGVRPWMSFFLIPITLPCFPSCPPASFLTPDLTACTLPWIRPCLVPRSHPISPLALCNIHRILTDMQVPSLTFEGPLQRFATSFAANVPQGQRYYKGEAWKAWFTAGASYGNLVCAGHQMPYSQLTRHALRHTQTE